MKSRNIKTIILLSMFVILLGSVVEAQVLGLRLKVIAQVPFDFNVGGKTMPEGQYELTNLNLMSGTGVIQLHGEKSVLARIALPTYSPKAKEQSVLIFNKYPETGGAVSYFLSQIWVAGQNKSYEFPKSRAERAAAKRAARCDLISIVVQRVNRSAE